MKNFLFAIVCFSISTVLHSQKSGNLIFNEDVLHEIRFEFEDLNYWAVLQQNFESTPTGQRVPYLMADVTIDGIKVDSIGMRLKGFTSYSTDTNKKPIKIDFNEFVEGKRFDGLRKLNLNNGTGDPSMQRDVICYKLLRSMGVKAPRTSYSKVYINDEFWGLYQNIEQIDKAFLQDNFANDKGNLFKNLAWSHFEYNGDDKSDYNEIFGLKTNEEGDDWSGFINLMDVLNNSSDEEFKNAIEKIFNVDLYLKTLAVDVATLNWDSYLSHGRNWYIYEDTSTGVFNWIPWDYNFALSAGSNNFDTTDCNLFVDFGRWTDGTETVKFYNTSFSGQSSTLLWDFGDGNTSTDEKPIHTYQEGGVYEVCLTLTQNADCEENTCYTIDTDYDISSCPSVENGSFPGEVGENFALTINWISTCCDTWNYECDELYGLLSGQGSGGSLGENFNINQENNSGVLIHRLLSVPEFKESYYSHFCNLNNNYFTKDIYFEYIDKNKDLIESTVENDPNYLFSFSDFLADSGDKGLKAVIGNRIDSLSNELQELYTCPENSAAIPFGNLVINEVLASNDSTSNIFDSEGEFDDWVELFNNTDADIDLSGAYLSDSKTDLMKWQFPVGTTIEKEGYLIIWADKDEGQDGIHSNFKLNKAGDELNLSNSDGTLIDFMSFGEQETNVAFARVPNGTGSFAKQGPTFAENNNLASSTKDIAKEELHVLIFPNPASTILNVQIENSRSKLFKIRIFAIDGKQVFESQNSNGLSMEINISNLLEGFYILTFIDEEGRAKNVKFVKRS